MSQTREMLIARVALLMGTREQIEGFDAAAAWKTGEEWVAAREKAPDEPVQCPCCEKLVTLCVEHWELHEPGKPCVDCRKAEGVP